MANRRQPPVVKNTFTLARDRWPTSDPPSAPATPPMASVQPRRQPLAPFRTRAIQSFTSEKTDPDKLNGHPKRQRGSERE